MNAFRLTFTAAPGHIDEMGHVNNAVWVGWIQELATAHWDAVAAPDHRERFAWLVLRHEIDYRGNIRAGQSATGETSIPGRPRGARFDRHSVFRDSGGEALVEALTTWAMIERASGRPAPIRPAIAAPFLERP